MMLKFYNELSKYYDDVFPYNNTTFNFLSSYINPNSSILDFACSTGTYAIELANQDHCVVAVDLNKKLIELAKNKTPYELNNRIRYINDDFLKINKYYKTPSFNLAFCIGNSIVHINDVKLIIKLFKDIKSLLNNDGKLVLQIINYDRIINKKVSGLPSIKTKDSKVEFVRDYKLVPQIKDKFHFVDFNTSLHVANPNGKKETYTNSIRLLALKKDQLMEMLCLAGYKNNTVFGSFAKDEFIEDESYALITVSS